MYVVSIVAYQDHRKEEIGFSTRTRGTEYNIVQEVDIHIWLLSGIEALDYTLLLLE